MDDARAWHIVNWDRHYEVNEKGGRWKPGEKKRLHPPEYIRWYLGGPKGDGSRYQECALLVGEKYGEESWAVAWGLFGKLVEIAGRQKPELRGYVLSTSDAPINSRILSRMIYFTQQQVEQGLAILSDPLVGWIEMADMPVSRKIPGKPPGTPDEFPETSGKSPKNPDQFPENGGTVPASLQEAKGEAKAQAEEKSDQGFSETKPAEKATAPVVAENDSPFPKAAQSPREGTPQKTSPEKKRQLAMLTAGIGTGGNGAAKLAAQIGEALGFSAMPPDRSAPGHAQYVADCNSILALAGYCRDGKISAEGVLEKAARLRRDDKAKNPMAVLVSWAKKILLAKGVRWNGRPP